MPEDHTVSELAVEPAKFVVATSTVDESRPAVNDIAELVMEAVTELTRKEEESTGEHIGIYSLTVNSMLFRIAQINCFVCHICYRIKQ